MRKSILLMPAILALGCATKATETSLQVNEFETIDEMNRLADCQPVESVYASFDVTMHSPAGRKRAAHVHLKDAAYALGANAVIMTSNNWGVVTDQVNGVAYKCDFGKPGSLASGTNAVTDDTLTDRYDRVREAKQLFDEGVLTKEEYEAEKRRILEAED